MADGLQQRQIAVAVAVEVALREVDAVPGRVVTRQDQLAFVVTGRRDHSASKTAVDDLQARGEVSLAKVKRLGDRMHGKTCAGTWVTGRGKDGAPRAVYLYHVVDSDWSWAEYRSQAVVWQTAINPVVALELLARGTWSGSGVLGAEAFAPRPFLDLLTAYGSPWGMREEKVAG